MSDGAGPSNPPNYTSVRVEIAVQPPAVVTINQRLHPPVVARTSHHQLVRDVNRGSTSAFATAQLVASNGEDATAFALAGTYHVTGDVVTEEPSGRGGGGGSSSGSSSRHRRRHSQPRQWLYFVFPALSVRLTGTYTLVLSVTVMSATVAETLAWRSTRSFIVTDQRVAPQRPSSAEREILNALEQAGVYRR